MIFLNTSQTIRAIIANTLAASLGTLSENGAPFVSLVTIASPDPTKLVMLLSGLAKHTRNLDRHSECSLLLIEPGGESGDPLAGARVTLSGRVRKLTRNEDESQRNCFLNLHASAAMYADFGDFAFYEFEVIEAHLVAGFGRIQTVSGDQLR